MAGTARLALVAALAVLSISCGAASGTSGQNDSVALHIDSAEWGAGQEPRVSVSGEWGKGISTPPSCDLLSGKGGKKSAWYDRGTGIELDGKSFHKEFVPGPGRPAPDPRTDYHVRCRVTGATGNSVEANVPVRGSAPGRQG